MKPYGLIIKYFFRRVLFEKGQQNGDCALTGRSRTVKRPPGITPVEENNIQEDK